MLARHPRIGVHRFLSSTISSSSPKCIIPSTAFHRGSFNTTPALKMSTQPAHPALLIPGPIEFDDAVLQSMSHFSESHVGPGFVAVFGETLSLLRQLFQTTDSAAQPFVISGSGTLGWDLVAANLVEAGEDVLVLQSGYFSDGFADCLTTYGANVTKVTSAPGSRPQLDEIEKALSAKQYKLLTVTHVDTSTGVLSELKKLSELVHKVSPETLIIVDGVCSVACEEIAFDEWKLDGVVTASQKAIGCPAGLSISMFSGKAMERFQNRKTPPASYFASMKNWTPKAFLLRHALPQLVRALHTALNQILTKPIADRFAAHRQASDKIKQAVTALGLQQVAGNPDDQAHGMTAMYLPDSVKSTDLLPILGKKGVVFAGGIHKEIATKYIRFGHMAGPSRTDIEKALTALKEGLAELGYSKP
ncbi:unnamed protein product [Parascedosporium putredinis]|uniref:alanine--glyoxylate transaminase n=1 Tax=Parascedosporium putredinis TaxID=1442378 RepID=A0A9P1H788_9PEZI|nr:unnamed protein product [Parascedosporium putredinis]CAI8001163.1 unnamed protein product [Parascedosporium putredinis]